MKHFISLVAFVLSGLYYLPTNAAPLVRRPDVYSRDLMASGAPFANAVVTRDIIPKTDVYIRDLVEAVTADVLQARVDPDPTAVKWVYRTHGVRNLRL